MAKERALIVIVQLDPRFTEDHKNWTIEDEANELRELVKATRCEVLGEIFARRHRPIAGTFLGSGKLQEIAQVALATKADVVVFNYDLAPSQQRNIENVLNTKSIDRTQLILDIFAARARSREGKIQVERAQLSYLLPRLTGRGIMLSRLGGGIGTRGPGEQKLEIDRRRIRQRISRLTDELKQVSKRRGATRSRRKESGIPVVALVGYTNAGKTTLLNALCAASGAAKDQLFTTLDPLARRVRLKDRGWVILTDTVGFLHHLPHPLIEAFKATLEEAADADLLLHVLDVSHPLIHEHAQAVDEVLHVLKLESKSVLTVLNKQDLLPTNKRLAALERAHAPAVAISAKTGQGLEALFEGLMGALGSMLAEPARLLVPAHRADLISAVYREGQVMERREENGSVALLARLPDRLRHRLKGYICP